MQPKVYYSYYIVSHYHPIIRCVYSDLLKLVVLKIGPTQFELLRAMKGAPDCLSARCGFDAGCKKVEDGSYICICTHDLSVEPPGKLCPRNVGDYLGI